MKTSRLEQIVDKELSAKNVRPEVVKAYVQKFKEKMDGSSVSTARTWVKGISAGANEDEKAEILKQIEPYIDYSLH